MADTTPPQSPLMEGWDELIEGMKRSDASDEALLAVGLARHFQKGEDMLAGLIEILTEAHRAQMNQLRGQVKTLNNEVARLRRDVAMCQASWAVEAAQRRHDAQLDPERPTF